MLSLLTYPPILRGFAVLLTAAAAFPVAGVWILRLNLLPYRFMLMHGALLGGVLGLSLGFAPLPAVVLVNLILVLLADFMVNRSRMDAGMATVFLMVSALGAAMALVYWTGVSAQDTLSLLWGNLFAVSPLEAVLTVFFCAGLVLFSRLFKLPVQAVIFDRDIAFTAGANDSAIMRVLLLLTGITVAFAMRVVGALLLDALLLVPAIIASVLSRGLESLYRNAVFIGLGIGVTGFAAALITDLPVGAATALVGAVVLGVVLVIKNRSKS